MTTQLRLYHVFLFQHFLFLLHYVPVDLPPPQLSILPPVPPPIPDAPCHTQHVSCSPGEWWKVRHPAEPPAEPPIIWSDDEEDAPEEQLANSVSDPEPHTFRQAMHGD